MEKQRWSSWRKKLAKTAWMFLEIFPEQQLVYQHHRKFYLPDIRRVANILLSMLTSGATVESGRSA
ncbi:MAG: hypothetical protein D3909_01000 [Candidatus Electrothrix sp. ATG1]|nr:hypothetical protein [Candidatus Electrothrix sp. ATG1]MCI5211727.1 hypothetical protein [Candidatus Electrothrix sp. ATG2]